MSLANAMSAVSNAQHADLAISNREKANRSQSRNRSLRRSRERKRNAKLTTIIDSLEIDIAKMQRVAVSHARKINALTSQTEHLAKNIYMTRSSIDALRMKINHQLIEEVVRQQQAGIMPIVVPHNFALNPQQQAAQAHGMMQQQQAVQPQMRMSSQLQVQMQFQPQVMIPPQGQGLILSSWPNVASWLGGEAAIEEGAHATPDQHMDAKGRPESSLAGGDVPA